MWKTLKKGLILAAATLALACVIPSVPVSTDLSTVSAAAKVKLNTKKTYLLKGKTKKLKLVNATGTVKWTSNKKSIATVTKSGVVKAKKSGTATITATYNNKKYKCKVIVESPKISKSKLTLTVGQSQKISLKNTAQTVKWRSTSSSVAAVTSKGVITAKKTGTATIYTKLYGKKYKCKVTVKSDTTQNTEPDVDVTFSKPNYSASYPYKTNSDCLVVYADIKNKGTSTMRVFSHYAMLLDKDYDTFNRSLKIFDADALQNYNQLIYLDYEDILPNQTKTVWFAVVGNDTWYDKYSTVCFQFTYDGKKYDSVGSYYYGTTFAASTN